MIDPHCYYEGPINVFVLQTLDGVESGLRATDYVPSGEAKKRVQQLGLQALFAENEGRTEQVPLEKNKHLEILERSVWKMAANVKSKRFGLYKDKDFKNALNFLESFCLYSAQANLVHQMQEDIIFRKHETDDKSVAKAVKAIEDINRLLESDLDKAGKKVLKKRIDTVHRLVGKIFNDDLNQTEQRAMVKVVERAEKILEKMKKSL